MQRNCFITSIVQPSHVRATCTGGACKLVTVFHSASTVEGLALCAPLLEHPSVFELHLHFTGDTHSLPHTFPVRGFPLPSPGAPGSPQQADGEAQALPGETPTAALAARYIPVEPVAGQEAGSPREGELDAGLDETQRMRGGESEDVAQYDNALKMWLPGKADPASQKDEVQWGNKARTEGAVRKFKGLAGRWESLFVWIGSWAASFWTLVRCSRGLQ
jgi:hypothetical protein